MTNSDLPHVTPAEALSTEVQDILEKATGLRSREAWTNIWLLISKSEQDNDKTSGTFEIETNKGSVFGYASALSYDQKKRGVTLGLVGWTTANDGKDGKGDAPGLFKLYKSLGGEDLMPLADGCCKSKDKCDKLIKKIHSIASDPKWIQAQWKHLVSEDGYIFQTMRGFKKIGIPTPSALAIGVVLDTSLNQGFDGPDGGVDHLIKLGVDGDEAKTLEKYVAWKTKVAGSNEYNDPPINGKNRGKMYEILLDAKCFSLKGCEKEIKKAVSWEMK